MGASRRGDRLPDRRTDRDPGALYLAITAAGGSKADLTNRLRLDEKDIRRMLDPRHATKLARIQEILRALGKRLVVRLEDAA